MFVELCELEREGRPRGGSSPSRTLSSLLAVAPHTRPDKGSLALFSSALCIGDCGRIIDSNSLVWKFALLLYRTQEPNCTQRRNRKSSSSTLPWRDATQQLASQPECDRDIATPKPNSLNSSTPGVGEELKTHSQPAASPLPSSFSSHDY